MSRTTEVSVTVREVIRLLWEVDSYPCLGNQDWATAARMEAAALEKAATALGSPNDLPEFGLWLRALQRRNLSTDEREEIYWEIQIILPRRSGAVSVISFYNMKSKSATLGLTNTNVLLVARERGQRIDMSKLEDFRPYVIRPIRVTECHT